MSEESKYWGARRVALFNQVEKNEKKLLKKLVDFYSVEIKKLDTLIASYYQQYGKNNVIEFRKLLTTISKADRDMLFQRMDDFARKYPRWAHLMPVRESIYKLDELESVKMAMRLQQLEIGAYETSLMQQVFIDEAFRSAGLAAEELGFGKNFYNVNSDVVRLTVGKQWADGKSFSDRIWDNKAKLTNFLHNDFAQGIVRGVNYETMMRDLRTRFANVSSRDAMRLIYTEGTFVLNEAQRQAHIQLFGDDGLYRVSTVTDSHVCDVCREVERATEKEPVRLADAIVGANFPPMHPNCRCTHIPALTTHDEWLAGIIEGMKE